MMTIYKIDEEGRPMDDEDEAPPLVEGKVQLRLSRDLPNVKPYEVLIRLYIIQVGVGSMGWNKMTDISSTTFQKLNAK